MHSTLRQIDPCITVSSFWRESNLFWQYSCSTCARCASFTMHCTAPAITYACACIAMAISLAAVSRKVTHVHLPQSGTKWIYMYVCSSLYYIKCIVWCKWLCMGIYLYIYYFILYGVLYRKRMNLFGVPGLLLALCAALSVHSAVVMKDGSTENVSRCIWQLAIDSEHVDLFVAMKLKFKSLRLCCSEDILRSLQLSLTWIS